MTYEDHKARHQLLHRAFDELIADWLLHRDRLSEKSLSNTAIMELMEWSHRQTQDPELPPGTTHEEKAGDLSNI